MRLLKNPEELESIKRACGISVAAHVKAMRDVKPGMVEYELEAILLHEFYRRGSRYPAYPSIVAGGKNACVLHYTRNDAVLEDNQLVLIDAGAEFDNYAADITRTFPVNGKFTASQQAIYELVLAAQLAAIESIKPGLLWTDIQQTILKIMVAGLVDLKILRGSVDSLIEQKAYFPFYMHNSGHWLGMDVHDVGDYKVKDAWRKLSPHMVFTIEPGLYFSPEYTKVPEQWRGIGVRIEDDILVTPMGSEVLTQGVPKSVTEIEKLVGKRD
jgi:Xaa-Pro aminopeptidase